MKSGIHLGRQVSRIFLHFFHVVFYPNKAGFLRTRSQSAKTRTADVQTCRQSVKSCRQNGELRHGNKHLHATRTENRKAVPQAAARNTAMVLYKHWTILISTATQSC